MCIRDRCQALYVGLLGWGSAVLQRRAVRPLVIALAWVTQEALRDRTPYGGFPWVRVAFSQADSPFGQVAALGGAPAVTFLVALAGGFLAYAEMCIRDRAWTRRMRWCLRRRRARSSR